MWKKNMLFLGLFSLFGSKKFLKFFHLATHHWSHQLLPLIITTNYWRAPLPPPTMVSGAVADAGGRWHQWWLAVVGDSSGCQRWWVGGVGWQRWVLMATVVLGWDIRCGHRVLLDSMSGLILSPSWTKHPPTLFILSLMLKFFSTIIQVKIVLYIYLGRNFFLRFSKTVF